jgi:hypothetical protein
MIALDSGAGASRYTITLICLTAVLDLDTLGDPSNTVEYVRTTRH